MVKKMIPPRIVGRLRERSPFVGRVVYHPSLLIVNPTSSSKVRGEVEVVRSVTPVTWSRPGAHVLQTTADPKEIALLAKNLAQQDTEQYRAEVLRAVNEALTMAANKSLEGSDVAPLFEVLQKYGGADAVSQLQQAGKQWNYYAAIALAQLPEGAGIPALIQIARDGTFANTTALEMVTQAAPQYSEARAALVEMARASRIAPSQWPYLTSLLAGDQFHYQDSAFDASNNRTPEGTAHVLFGNQHFFTPPLFQLVEVIVKQFCIKQ